MFIQSVSIIVHMEWIWLFKLFESYVTWFHWHNFVHKLKCYCQWFPIQSIQSYYTCSSNVWTSVDFIRLIFMANLICSLSSVCHRRKFQFNVLRLNYITDLVSENEATRAVTLHVQITFTNWSFFSLFVQITRRNQIPISFCLKTFALLQFYFKNYHTYPYSLSFHHLLLVTKRIKTGQFSKRKLA